MTTFVFDAYGTLYDVNSVAKAIEQAFPGRSDVITQVWRLKQLEYTWLRSLMERYEDFWAVTRESLVYTLDSLGIEPEAHIVDPLLERYLHLEPFTDTAAALAGLREQGHRLAILSNGSPMMLDTLTRNTGLDTALDAVISVDTRRAFKPAPSVYALVEDTLHVPPHEVVFVSCNPFDACGARHFGFKVAWIERVTASSLQAEIAAADTVGPNTLFKLLRMRMDAFDLDPDIRIHTLTELLELPPGV